MLVLFPLCHNFDIILNSVSYQTCESTMYCFWLLEVASSAAIVTVLRYHCQAWTTFQPQLLVQYCASNSIHGDIINSYNSNSRHKMPSLQFIKYNHIHALFWNYHTSLIIFKLYSFLFLVCFFAFVLVE